MARFWEEKGGSLPLSKWMLYSWVKKLYKLLMGTVSSSFTKNCWYSILKLLSLHCSPKDLINCQLGSLNLNYPSVLRKNIFKEIIICYIRFFILCYFCIIFICHYFKLVWVTKVLLQNHIFCNNLFSDSLISEFMFL